MKRSLRFLSLSFFLIAIAFAQISLAQQPQPEKLSKQQLHALIVSARSPAEHNRLAAYYSAEAQRDLAQAEEHEQMAARYNNNIVASSSKFSTGTVKHCEYLAQQFKDRAAKALQMEREHEEMATQAGQM